MMSSKSKVHRRPGRPFRRLLDKPEIGLQVDLIHDWLLSMESCLQSKNVYVSMAVPPASVSVSTQWLLALSVTSATTVG